MKIDYAIHSSDSNEMYLSFWPIVSKIWKLKFNIEPILIYIDKNQNLEIDETYGKVIRITEVGGIPTYLQNLWVRYWYPINFPDKVSIISDIDMFPISKDYFIDSIKDIDIEKYIHLNPIVDRSPHQLPLPSCYHVASGKKFKEVLELPDSWEESIFELYNTGLGFDHGGELQGKDRWGSDERYATIKINNYKNQDDLVFIKRNGGQSGYRIDRSNWNYVPDKVINGEYIDSHSIRPYNLHKNEIDSLIKLII